MEVPTDTACVSAFPSNVAGIASEEHLKGEEMKNIVLKEKTMKPHGLPQLRILRQRKGLSLGQLADLTGIRRDTIAHFETGRVDPEPYHVRLLARVLEVPTLSLVS